MAKRGRPRIHPPNIPKGEQAKITIANQENQIRMLVDRCEELQEARDVALAEADISDGLRNDASEQVGKLEAVIQRMTGWQDLARELLQPKSTGA
jgi:flagellin-specific chaperone FliS